MLTGTTTITDPEFGDMKYIYGWVNTIQEFFGDTGFSFLCVAEAKPWEDILPIQRKMHKKFSKHQKSIVKKINNDLSSLLYTPEGPRIVPKELRFTRDGKVLLIFDALWEGQDEVRLSIYPKFSCEEIKSRGVRYC